jgi:enoyl-CoA hydratase
MAATEYDYQLIRYERPSERVVRIMLARPEVRNAQNTQMLYEIDAALDAAMLDNSVGAVIIGADGPHFSAGHDLKPGGGGIGDYGPPKMGVGGFGQPGQEGHMAHEQEVFIGFCWRWRNMPKPTIAAVQGKAIAGGLMLVWPFDLIVAAENAQFSDPVVTFGVNGVEYFVHAWEVGARKAKEMLFTGESIGAQEAKELGMVNRVVKLEDLEQETLSLAEKIAKQPSMGLKLAKMSVNQSLDAQGMYTAIQAAFGMHHLGHANMGLIHGKGVEPTGAVKIKTQAKADVPNLREAE